MTNSNMENKLNRLHEAKAGTQYFSKYNPFRVYELDSVGDTEVQYHDDVGNYVLPIYEFVQNYTEML